MSKELKALMKKNKELILYVVVGGLTTLVSMASYYGLVLTVLDPRDPIKLQAANVISWLCAVTFAYVANRRLVFESKSEKVAGEALRFFGARLFTLGVDMLFMGIWVGLLELNDKWGKLVVQLVVLILNYVFSKCFVFVKEKNR